MFKIGDRVVYRSKDLLPNMFDKHKGTIIHRIPDTQTYVVRFDNPPRKSQGMSTGNDFYTTQGALVLLKPEVKTHLPDFL